ncbi:hypothetical protein [Algoriphagus boritolerans]|uniref:hypothetical protein n=1 Tax=Algoriphagus boritolerans TaxID=308111 RepID=UPI002FCDF535
MVRTMFEYVKEFADSVFYDASAWTMAAAYGMPFAAAATAKSGTEITTVATPEFTFPEGKAYAYLIDWSDYYAPKILFELQKNRNPCRGNSWSIFFPNTRWQGGICRRYDDDSYGLSEIESRGGILQTKRTGCQKRTESLCRSDGIKPQRN